MFVLLYWIIDSKLRDLLVQSGNRITKFFLIYIYSLFIFLVRLILWIRSYLFSSGNLLSSNRFKTKRLSWLVSNNSLLFHLKYNVQIWSCKTDVFYCYQYCQLICPKSIHCRFGEWSNSLFCTHQWVNWKWNTSNSR